MEGVRVEILIKLERTSCVSEILFKGCYKHFKILVIRQI